MKWRVIEFLVPLLFALWANSRLEPSRPTPPLPATALFQDEQAALLDRSETRLRAMEAKGPGLATVTAIVAAASATAVSVGWETCWPVRLLLIGASLYTVMSLWAPLLLLGPLRRFPILRNDLEELSTVPAPRQSLAQLKGDRAARNDHELLKLANLQSASRDSLRNAVVLLLVWLGLRAFGIGK